MRGLTREAKNKLLKYAWPGNVRELQHTMERAVILGGGSLLRPGKTSCSSFCFPSEEGRRSPQLGAIGTAGCGTCHAAQ